MGEGQFQAKIMQALTLHIGSGEMVCKWLQRVLDLEYSTARRKYKGDIKISLAQFDKIVKGAPYVLTVALDSVLSQNTFLTTYSSFRDKREVIAYLKVIIKRFEKGLAHKACLRYVARDLPLFFFLADRRLAEFKISIWSHQLGDKGLMKMDIETYSLCKEVHRLYMHLESIEVWSKSVLSKQPRMINWFCDIKRIDEGYRKGLYEALHEQVVRYKDWSASGLKDGHGEIDLLFTDFITMNNGGLLEAPSMRHLMTAISSVNFVTFDDPVLCKNFTDEFEQHRSYATSVTCQNTLQRELCFDYLLKELSSNF